MKFFTVVNKCSITFSVGNILNVKAAVAVVGIFHDDMEVIGSSIPFVWQTSSFLCKIF